MNKKIVRSVLSVLCLLMILSQISSVYSQSSTRTKIRLFAQTTGFDSIVTRGDTLVFFAKDSIHRALLSDLDSTNEIIDTILYLNNQVLLIEGNDTSFINIDSISDHDWYTTGTTNPPNSINNSIYTMGTVGIGILNPSGAFHVHTDDSRDVIFSRSNSAPANDMDIDVYRTRGTLASPIPIQNGDHLGSFRFNSFNFASFSNPFTVSTEIRSIADGTVSPSSAPGKLAFYTTPIGSNIALERFIIKNSGFTGINIANPTNLFHVVTQSGSQDPVRFEGIRSAQTNDTSVLVTNPSDGTIRTLSKNKIRDNYFEIQQNSHGFILPSWGVLPITYDNSTNLYELAISDSLKNTSDLLLVSIPNANTLGIQNTGYLNQNHGLDIGHWWVLNHTTAGGIERADTSNCENNDSLIYQRLFFTASNNTILLQPEEPKTCISSTPCVNPSLVSLLDSMIIVSGSLASNKDTILVTGNNFSPSTSFSISPSTNLTLDGYSIVSGTQALIYIDYNASGGFPTSSVTYTLTVSTGNCIGNNTKTFVLLRDAIRGAMQIAGCASCTAYDAASPNTPVPITLAEYNSIQTNVSLANVKGASNMALFNNAYGSLNDVGNSVNTGQWTALDPNSYVIAFSFKTYTNFTGNIQLVSAPNSTGTTTCITSATPSYSWTTYTDRYFAVKRPSNSNGSNLSLGRITTIGSVGAAGRSGGTGRYFQVSTTSCGTAMNSNVNWDPALQAITTTLVQW